MRGFPDSPDLTPAVREAAVFDFVNDFLDDLECGEPRRLSEYLARYPDHQAAVAREYLNLSRDALDQTQVSVPGAPPPDSPGPRRVGPYRLLRQLGEGGQGAVFLAEDTRIARRVAIKLLRAGFVSEMDRRRFRREAEAIVGLEHPGLCGILEAEVEGDTPYLAMRYVPGMTLAESIALASSQAEASGVEGDETPTPDAGMLPLPPRTRPEIVRVLRFFERAARALHAAHAAGVIHRDIKPGNIIVTPDGEPVVLDFGLARSTDPGGDDEALTVSGQVFGTPLYMSPEQLRGRRDELDERTDVYSLGASLYETLTGSRPFRGGDRVALEQAILMKPVPDPRGLNEALDEDVKVVLQTALEKDSGHRYTSALKLAEDLRRVIEFEPIRARPAGPLLRLQRWSRRQPVVASLLLLTLLSLTAGLVVSLSALANERAAVRNARGQLLATRVPSIAGEDPEAALAIAVEASELAPNYSTRSAVFVALDACRVERLLTDGGVARFFDLSFDPEMRRLAVAPGLAPYAPPEERAHIPIWDLSDGSMQRRLPSTERNLRSIAWSPTGGELLVGGESGGLELWGMADDGSAPRETLGLAEPAEQHSTDHAVIWLEFAPDGRTAAAQLVSGETCLIGLEPLRVLRRLTSKPHTAGCARFTPDGTRLLVTSVRPNGLPVMRSSVPLLYDLETGGPARELAPHRGNVQWSAISDDSSRAATVCDGGQAVVWSLATGERIGVPVDVEGRLNSVAFAPGGETLALSGLQDGQPAVWLVEVVPSSPGDAGGEVDWHVRRLSGLGETVVHVEFDPSGERLFTSARGRLSTWDVSTSQLLERWPGLILPMSSTWTRDGRRLVTLGQTNKVRVWRAGEQPYCYDLAGHEGPVRWVEFDPQGERALSLGDDGMLRVWSTPAGLELDAHEDPGAQVSEVRLHAGAVSATHRAGRELLSVGADGRIVLTDLETCRPTWEAEHSTRGVSGAYVPGVGVVAVEESGAAWLHRDPTSDRPQEPLRLGAGFHLHFTRVAVAPGGEQLLLAGRNIAVDQESDTEDVAALLLDSAGRLLRTISYRHRGQDDMEVFDASWSGSGQEIVLACSDKVLRFFDPATARHTRPELWDGVVRGLRLFRPRMVRYAPSSDRVLAIGRGGGASLRWIDLDQGRGEQPAVVQKDELLCSAISDDASLVATGSRDLTVLVWEASGLSPIVERLHDAPVTALAFSSESSRRVISGTAAGSVRVWPVDPLSIARARMPRELTTWERRREATLGFRSRD